MLTRLLFGAAMVGAGLAVGQLLGRKPEPKLKKPIFDVRKGDMVQWECRGSFIFPTPKKVEKVIESDSGTYVFVEGTSTGIPVEQIILIEKAEAEEDEPAEPSPGHSTWSSQIVRRHPDYVR